MFSTGIICVDLSLKVGEFGDCELVLIKLGFKLFNWIKLIKKFVLSFKIVKKECIFLFTKIYFSFDLLNYYEVINNINIIFLTILFINGKQYIYFFLILRLCLLNLLLVICLIIWLTLDLFFFFLITSFLFFLLFFFIFFNLSI